MLKSKGLDISKKKRNYRMRSLSCPSEEKSLSSSSKSPPKKRVAVKEEKNQEEDTTCPEYFESGSKKVLARLQCRFADGELERLGIVNLS